MKAMILAAGRGERMMPLTANKPKPMLVVAGKPLIQHHIESLASANIKDIVINHAWCGDVLVDYLGDGSQFGVTITYSDESSGALETAGGIINALPLLFDDKTPDDSTFLVINGDVYCSMDYSQLIVLADKEQACLWLVDNPEHNPSGDFLLNNGTVDNKKTRGDNETSFTFSGIALYKRSFFESTEARSFDKLEKLALGPMLRAAAEHKQLKGIALLQAWTDVGTPERLKSLNLSLAQLNKRGKNENLG